MKNSVKRRLPKIWIILAIILSAIIVLFSSLSICIYAFGNYNPSPDTGSSFKLDYKMNEIFKNKGNTLVTDIAMLGSHDAFSYAITKTSPLDPAETATYMTLPIIRQITSHFSKAQTMNVFDQLERGVRYFDIRLSKIGTSVFSKHVLLSEEIANALLHLTNFADLHKGEVIVLDFQHIYLDNGNVEELFANLSTKTANSPEHTSDTNIFDYVHYDTTETPLAKLTYADVTKNGTETGFVILMKDEVLNKGLPNDKTTPNFDKNVAKIYSRDNAIISTWHNKLSDEEMFKGIDNELIRLKSIETNGIFVVNQAQKTPSIAPQNIFLNLLTLADGFNHKHLQRENFAEQLQAMPIFMVDNATTSASNFNFDAMTKIYNYNMNLNVT